MSEQKVYAVLDMKEKGIFNICQPTFEVYAIALRKMVTQDREVDTVMSGRVIFDSCYLGNNGTLEEIQKDPLLYASICMAAAEDLTIYQGELKKN